MLRFHAFEWKFPKTESFCFHTSFCVYFYFTLYLISVILASHFGVFLFVKNATRKNHLKFMGFDCVL
jgi:hypothetical protein